MYFTDCLVLVSLSYSHSFPGNVLQGAQGWDPQPLLSSLAGEPSCLAGRASLPSSAFPGRT